jgi:beta-glucosidase
MILMKTILSLGISTVPLIFFRGAVYGQGSLIPVIPGWSLHQEEQVYDSNNLWDIIDGAADLYLEYNFTDLHTARYSAPDIEIKAEIYKHASPLDAFGIYSQERDPGYHFLKIGTQGYLQEGVLNFLCGGYYIKLSSNQKGNKVQDALAFIAGKLNDHLKQEAKLPEEFLLFPDELKDPNSEKYISQNFLGYNFMNSAFTVTYGGNKSFTAFLLSSPDEAVTDSVMKRFLSSQAGSNVSKTAKETYEIQNNSGGSIFLGKCKKYIYGLINCMDKGKQVDYMDLIKNKIMSLNMPWIRISAQSNYIYKPFQPKIGFEDASKRADALLSKLTLEEKIELIGGHRFFYIKGFDKYGIPELYLSDATQGVHIRKELNDQLKKSTAFPCPIALSATWNIELANKYAESIGEECRAGGIAVLLGPGMNIYRISQNGRNFEYFGEDPFLAARMIENYVSGLQSTGTIATLKHFLCNNTEYYRRKSNSIVDERAIHEIYTPAFKAGIDAGAMAVMTSYNQVNGEWSPQSHYVVTDLLRNDLGFKWLVMSDWWSTWDPVKTMKSGLDLEMPGEAGDRMDLLKKMGEIFVKDASKKLLEQGKISENDINRMAGDILRTEIAMGLMDRPVKDDSLLDKYGEHERVALQTAREAIVLLRNENKLLPILPDNKNKILLTGDYVEKIAKGGGSAEVEGYNHSTLLQALKNVYGDNLDYAKEPSDEEIKSAGAVLVSIGTHDSEGLDRYFELPAATENRIIKMAGLNRNVVVIVNTGGGIRMTGWNQKVAAILYAWYLGQNGNNALAEVISGKTNPSGKLPISIEKKFEDSPGYPYIPKGEKLYENWADDMSMSIPIRNVEYKEGIFVGYRYYEAKKIEPLYPFGFGLSYSSFEYSGLKLSKEEIIKGENLSVSFLVKNTGSVAGYETAELYIRDRESSVPRPVKELKGFKKVFLEPGESKTVEIPLCERDFSFWDPTSKDWKAEPGEFIIMVGTSSNDIRESAKLMMK